MFPPSFYYIHSEDEIRKYTDEIIVELEKLLEEFAESSEAQINDSQIPDKTVDKRKKVCYNIGGRRYGLR